MEPKRMKVILLSATILILSLSISTVVIFYQNNRPLQNEMPEVEENGFSVIYRGFVPGYNASYPDYYICINDLLNDTLQMNIKLEIKNQEASGYYFKVDKYEEPPANWTINPDEIGYVDVDQTITYVCSKIYRDKPNSITEGRITETINLAVMAYYDSGYTSFYSQDNFTVTYHFLDLTSSAWTILEFNNFDDGTTQNWGWVSGSGGTPQLVISGTYYRSYPYSLRISQGFGSNYQRQSGYLKSFNIGSGYQEAFLVFSVRCEDWGNYGTVLNGTRYFGFDIKPLNDVWYQFAIPLPIDTTTTVEIWVIPQKPGGSSAVYAHLDNVYLIAK